MKLKKIVLNTALSLTAIFTISGCSALQEGFASQMEVPSLENQANRVAIGMTIVRENNIMAFKMPISADAKWPVVLSKKITKKDEQFITELLMDDPYFATAHYTKAIQRKMLGSSKSMSGLGQYGNMASAMLDQAVSPLTFRAIKKIDIFYNNPKLKAKSTYKNQAEYYKAVRKNYPDIFDYNPTLASFLDFTGGKMQQIDSPTGDIHESLGLALISLAPTSLQKDLEDARSSMLNEFEEVASLNLEKGDLTVAFNQKSLADKEKLKKQKELALIETKIKEAESVANEKEAIYFNLLDQLVLALETDIDLSDENYVKLAQNINVITNEIEASSLEAYTAFALAIANIATNDIIQKFPKELESLALGKATIPANLQNKYNERMLRLAKNTMTIVPNAMMGTYYAYKQSTLAEKYASVTSIIVLAAEVKREQDAEQAAEQAKQKKS